MQQHFRTCWGPLDDGYGGSCVCRYRALRAYTNVTDIFTGVDSGIAPLSPPTGLDAAMPSLIELISAATALVHHPSARKAKDRQVLCVASRPSRYHLYLDEFNTPVSHQTLCPLPSSTPFVTYARTLGVQQQLPDKSDPPLYDVWGSSYKAMDEFGIGVGLYYRQLLTFAIVRLNGRSLSLRLMCVFFGCDVDFSNLRATHCCCFSTTLRPDACRSSYSRREHGRHDDKDALASLNDKALSNKDSVGDYSLRSISPIGLANLAAANGIWFSRHGNKDLARTAVPASRNVFCIVCIS